MPKDSILLSSLAFTLSSLNHNTSSGLSGSRGRDFCVTAPYTKRRHADENMPPSSEADIGGGWHAQTDVNTRHSKMKVGRSVLPEPSRAGRACRCRELELKLKQMKNAYAHIEHELKTRSARCQSMDQELSISHKKIIALKDELKEAVEELDGAKDKLKTAEQEAEQYRAWWINEMAFCKMLMDGDGSEAARSGGNSLACVAISKSLMENKCNRQ